MVAKRIQEGSYGPDDVVMPGDPIETGRLEGVLGFHLRMASVAFYQDFSAAMSEIGLTQKQFAVMELIAQNPGSSQIDLAAELSMDRATMMALINRLQDRNFVERRPSPFDGRRQQLLLTDHGHAVLAASREIIAAHETRFTELFTDRELETFISFLKRIYNSSAIKRNSLGSS
ncbi:winged helix-turn-helix transcriptional regulator (plasmid) [Peteryoungia desertarenae]|uniref:Winged helix-turn-helix transcriptional regulator n=1 Tax=Peteryoungia desertarenae TaxID=1813451 RepID=A0ABX6QT73_9HYPH|nr:MarR family winged helix-turn-helix transcriptional regulator [Peteryoungia desertarenae]QLF71668.1 winged helix-turn-helix transcriptional regulator [Peteryoungia desertarenae]